MKTDLFLDTSFAIAGASPRDQFHEKSKIWLAKIQAENINLITTKAVLLEIGNALSKNRFREIGANILAHFEDSSSITVVPITDSLYSKGFNLFCNRPDKEWGLVDCISFVVMSENQITEALTADEHFNQAGFNALLLQ